MMHLTEEQLFDLSEGVLTPTEQAAIAQHIAECANCRAQVSLARSVNSALVSQALMEPSKHFTHNVMRAIESESFAPVQVANSARTVWNTRYAFIAAFLLIAGLCVSPFFVPSQVLPGVATPSSMALQSFVSAITRFFANPLTPICLSAAIIVVAFSFFETLLPRSSRR